MQTKKLTKCNFCVYFVGNQCTVTPNSYYCKDANNEFFAWLEKIKQGKSNNNYYKK